MLLVRSTFDLIIDTHDDFFNRHLGVKSCKVPYKNFENGIVKVLTSQVQGMVPILTKSEEKAVSCFLDPLFPIIDAGDSIDNAAESSNLLLSNKRIKVTPRSKYISLKWIPPTLAIVVNFFSRMNNFFSPNLSVMETTMMLECNRECWNVFTVNKIYFARRLKGMGGVNIK
jgi:hypothetical protein